MVGASTRRELVALRERLARAELGAGEAVREFFVGFACTGQTDAELRFALRVLEGSGWLALGGALAAHAEAVRALEPIWPRAPIERPTLATICERVAAAELGQARELYRPLVRSTDPVDVFVRRTLRTLERPGVRVVVLAHGVARMRARADPERAPLVRAEVYARVLDWAADRLRRPSQREREREASRWLAALEEAGLVALLGPSPALVGRVARALCEPPHRRPAVLFELLMDDADVLELYADEPLLARFLAVWG